MGFLSGRVSFRRYRVSGRPPRQFGPEQLASLAEHAIGRQRVASSDGSQAGWTAGDHILDIDFDLAKNVVNDALHCLLRIDRQRVPADLVRAYTQIELRALAAENPSGLPSARQKREARAKALERLEKEAEDGRFLSRRAYPILWDGLSNELLVGTTAAAPIEYLTGLFQHTFRRSLEAVGAGRRAFLLAEAREQTRGIDDASPSPFVPGSSAKEVIWTPDDADRDFLGNEFLVWLWYVLDDDDTVTLADGTDVAVMLARQLVLECPRGQTGRESIHSDSPGRLPEARRALQSGKLPRQAGLTLARHDRQHELTLQAETQAVGSARLPAPEGEDERARLEERVTLLRHLVETLDLLYDAFGRRRAGSGWPQELARMQKWLRGNA
jgi:hypothetical protein